MSGLRELSDARANQIELRELFAYVTLFAVGCAVISIVSTSAATRLGAMGFLLTRIVYVAALRRSATLVGAMYLISCALLIWSNHDAIVGAWTSPLGPHWSPARWMIAGAFFLSVPSYMLALENRMNYWHLHTLRIGRLAFEVLVVIPVWLFITLAIVVLLSHR